MKRWHNGHSLGAGVLGGVLMSSHAWLLVVVGIAIGITLAYMRQSAAWIAQKVDHWRQHGPSKREPIVTEPLPVYSTRARRRNVREDIPF